MWNVYVKEHREKLNLEKSQEDKRYGINAECLLAREQWCGHLQPRVAG